MASSPEFLWVSALTAILARYRLPIGAAPMDRARNRLLGQVTSLRRPRTGLPV
ncbi:hypothetical protein GCM10027280_57850 [Micromonospora polyrhachis]|uniref:Uncharacterized protein n=1 Tax=Micromonospora polyrhachis TaxID=1282883 RepID=A0A7W7SNA6_9ACTN|nr:hypothetical protein [Micromonospora polyrhachis]